MTRPSTLRTLAGGLLLLAFFTHASAQEQQPAPRVQWAAKEHDFGTLKQGTPAEYVFEFTNVSTDTLLLDNPKASCGCTAALMSADNLPPGTKGTIRVRFTPPVGFHGSVTKTVTVYTRPDSKILEVLRITARVIGDLEPSRDMIRFNGIAGEKMTERVTLTSIAEKPVKLDNISASLMEYRDTTAGDQYHSDKVVAKPFTNFALSTEKLELKPGEKCDLVFVLTGEEKGQINGSIRISTGSYETIVSVAGVVMRKKQ
jgi:hypothetical protein